MGHLLEMKQQIERVRRELDAAVLDGIGEAECYRLSVHLDKLIANYMQLREDKSQLRNCR